MAGGREKGAGDRLLRALSHPVRIEVLRLLSDRTASPKALANEMNERLSNVSYHCSYLRREGCIEVVETEPRRGAVEHYYRLKTQPYDVAIRNFLGETVRALNAGTLDASHLGWTTLELDEEGRRELRERQAQWLEELDQLKASAAARLAAGGEGGRQVIAGAMGFEAPGSNDSPGAND